MSPAIWARLRHTLIDVEVGECQIKVSTLELFFIQPTHSSQSAIIFV